MKKILLAVFVTVVTMHTAFGQWTTSGANIYNSNTGNVGIGTTTPGAKLTVNQSTSLGDTAKAYVLLTTTEGVASNAFEHNSWIVRNAAGTDWTTTRLHDAISIGTTYITPQVNTKTWWERDPSNNIQSWGNGTNTYMTISAGNVGIGTVTPLTNLDVISTSWNFGITNTSSGALGGTSGGGLMASTSLSPTATGQRLGSIDFGALYTGAGTYSYKAAIMGYSSNAWSTTDNSTYLSLYTTAIGSVSQVERMRIDNAGNVSVGTTSSQGYKFAVDGTAIATSMTVKAYANWPDYVLYKNFSLPELSKVKNYIERNHHLQDIPSAADIAKNGLNLGDMDNALVKKTEELTLYTINEDNQIKKQQETINTQQQEIDALNQQLKQLQTAVGRLESNRILTKK
jgi:hypothetical protein